MALWAQYRYSRYSRVFPCIPGFPCVPGIPCIPRDPVYSLYSVYSRIPGIPGIPGFQVTDVSPGIPGYSRVFPCIPVYLPQRARAIEPSGPLSQGGGPTPWLNGPLGSTARQASRGTGTRENTRKHEKTRGIVTFRRVFSCFLVFFDFYVRIPSWKLQCFSETARSDRKGTSGSFDHSGRNCQNRRVGPPECGEQRKRAEKSGKEHPFPLFSALFREASAESSHPVVLFYLFRDGKVTIFRVSSCFPCFLVYSRVFPCIPLLIR